MNADEIKKFASYLIVGGSAAIVEWVTFYLFNIVLSYQLATILSFVVATTFNYYLGKVLTFKNDKKPKNDLLLVFGVSIVGLLLNVIIMSVIIDVIKFKYEMLAKIFSTGVVLIWNYLSRRLLIYKNSN